MEEQQNNEAIEAAENEGMVEVEPEWQIEGEDIGEEEAMELAQLLEHFKNILLAHEVRLATIENFLAEIYQRSQKPKMVVPKGK